MGLCRTSQCIFAQEALWRPGRRCAAHTEPYHTNTPWALPQELFREKHYADLDGGILEGFGRLLKFDLKLYVYPTLDDRTGELITADNVKARLRTGPV